VAERLKRWRESRSNSDKPSLIVGGNIGKNKDTPNETAWKDYERCFETLYPWVDYFVVNVSSPNTPGLRQLQEKESLRTILTRLQSIRSGQSARKPILLKIAPDLNRDQLDDIIDLSNEIGLDGLVATNTTTARDGLITPSERLHQIGAGGLSGRPLRTRSTELVRYLCERSGGTLPVIASGGVFTAEDAREKQEAGAMLVQVWTGFVYQGPSIAKNIIAGWKKTP
jgi:dihydroorotate dehydrogenase